MLLENALGPELDDGLLSLLVAELVLFDDGSSKRRCVHRADVEDVPAFSETS